MSKRSKFMARLGEKAALTSKAKADPISPLVEVQPPSPCRVVDEGQFSAFNQRLTRGMRKTVKEVKTVSRASRVQTFPNTIIAKRALDKENNINASLLHSENNDTQLEEVILSGSCQTVTSPELVLSETEPPNILTTDEKKVLSETEPPNILTTDEKKVLSETEPPNILTTDEKKASDNETDINASSLVTDNYTEITEITPSDRQTISLNLPAAKLVLSAPETSLREHAGPASEKEFCKRKLDFGFSLGSDDSSVSILEDDGLFNDIAPGLHEIEIAGVIDELPQEISEADVLIELEETEENVDEQDLENRSTKQRTRTYNAPEKLTRKRQTNTTAWKRNIAKEKLNSGEEHFNAKGQLIKGRKVQLPCDESCRMKCTSQITEDERKEIHKHFWAIKSHADKWDYIAHNVIQEEKKRSTVKNGGSKRNFSRTYSFRITGRKVPVCKTMFLKTLDIPDGWVTTSMKKKNKNGYISPDKRGTNKPKPRPTNEARKNSVRQHIDFLPRMESHYTRATSSKEYLVEEITSIADMHAAYKEWMQENHPTTDVATYRQYCDIFNNEYNISFFLSKKDQCDLCVGYQNASDEAKKYLQEEYDKHCLNKDIAQTIRMADTKVAQLKSSKNLCVANFDYQKTLICPRAKASVFYYHRKLSFNNFTVVDSGQAEDYCYCYNETVAAKGSNEVASFLYDFIEMKVKKGVTDFRFYSDNCSGQNKNRAVVAMYLHAASKFNIHICHTFLEKGHTWNAADNVHSLIERKIGNRDVYAPEEYLQLIATAKRNKLSPINIIDVHQDQVFNWKGHLVPLLQLDKDEEKRPIPWSKLREVSVRAGQDHTFSFKVDLNASAKIATTKGVGRPVNLKNYEPKHAYVGPLPIAKLKYNDLQQYCNKNLIPSKYHDL